MASASIASCPAGSKHHSTIRSGSTSPIRPKNAAPSRRRSLRRQGEPLDVASMVLFLCSPQGRYIAGTSIVIDGGYTAV
jgi:NAD(P)-dependent dehydrogenase (short-subunit alcohol dehydrogenase family)